MEMTAWPGSCGAAAGATQASTSSPTHVSGERTVVVEVAPPGGGIPHIAPVGYQLYALRQVIHKLSETMTSFDYGNLEAVLLN
jgi:hypothetical protein